MNDTVLTPAAVAQIIDIPNSMTVLPELLPMSITMVSHSYHPSLPA